MKLRGYIHGNNEGAIFSAFIVAKNEKAAVAVAGITMAEFKKFWKPCADWPVKPGEEGKLYIKQYGIAGGEWHDPELRKALRWTDPVKPDVPPPDNEAGYGTKQGARHLYSTRLLALRALRHSVEMECAKRLRDVDDLIRREKYEPSESI